VINCGWSGEGRKRSHDDTIGADLAAGRSMRHGCLSRELALRLAWREWFDEVVSYVAS